MRLLPTIMVCVFLLTTPVSAMEFTAPPVPDEGKQFMPEETASFQDGLEELVRNTIGAIRPDLKEAARVGTSLVSIALIISIMQTFSIPIKKVTEVVGAVAITTLLLLNTQSMICLAADTVNHISEYGKLLLMVMAAALAAQGGVTASASLYAGTALFDSLLMSIMQRFLINGIWLFLALCVANSATGEDFLKKTADFLKGVLSWTLKTLLMVFTTYLGITGVVSGTTDAVALKAAKVTISSFVPVVGGVLSDASEAILISAGVMKNAAGIYGILAVLAVFLHPFLQIGVHYMILKFASAVCAIFGSKGISDLIERFSTAMGFLLGITGSCCVMILVSTVCFMKGVG